MALEFFRKLALSFSTGIPVKFLFEASLHVFQGNSTAAFPSLHASPICDVGRERLKELQEEVLFDTEFTLRLVDYVACLPMLKRPPGPSRAQLQARIWPGLSYMSHIHSTAADVNVSGWKVVALQILYINCFT